MHNAFKIFLNVCILKNYFDQWSVFANVILAILMV